ncbi:amidase family protein [Candidatus Mycoplasma haematohominis]|uniref:amidase family protein n=1 Tax=Candidatus Mycoplasma haematohominis TaxID=1494318 RepID=UPI001C0A6E03|nr:amidase family protein [Candidatus Mycoplasma haemohominis]
MSSQILKTLKKYKNVEELLQALEKVKNSNSYLFDSVNKSGLIKKYSEGSFLDSADNLSGYLFSIKDLISNTDGIVTGGSKFLENCEPPFNASVYKALNNAGALNLVNSNLDEFGLGGTGLFSFTGQTPNPFNEEYISGGSSSGSAYWIKNELVDFSIGSDTGDSARYQESLCGIVGFKPSFGIVSRYGFYPFCSSFDTPSILSKSIEVIAKVLSVISFPDSNDLCTLGTKKKNYLEELKKPLNKNLKIAIFDQTFWTASNLETDVSRTVKDKFEKLVENIKSDLGFSVEICKFEDPRLLKLCELIYRVIAYSESISNYSNLTGILFPFKKSKSGVEVLNVDKGKNYQEILFNNRSVLGEEFVYRQILGKHFLEKENYKEIYLRCKKLLTAINREVKSLFDNYDLILSPTTIDLPPKRKEWKRGYSPKNVLNILLLANFCGLPAISIPWETVEGMPFGLHLMSKFKSDDFLLNVSNYLMDWIVSKD